MNIFDKLFNGEVFPAEAQMPKTREYKAINKEIDNYMEIFREKLSTEDYHLLDEMIRAICVSRGMTDSYFFAYGFKLATIMLSEVFVDDLGLTTCR